MPRPSKRTRSRKRSYKSLPGGGQGIHYTRGANAPQLCSVCRKPLAGIPQTSKSEASRINRTKRRTQRPYGGQMCPSCLKKSLKQAARSI